MDDRLVFDSRYRVGVDQVDQEHQELFKLAGNIHESLLLDVIVPMAEIRQAITELVKCTRAHFASEEILMGASSYPNLADHRALHAGLIARIIQFEAEVDKAERLTPVDVYQFLCSWLGDHILTSDRMFGEFMSRRSSAQ